MQHRKNNMRQELLYPLANTLLRLAQVVTKGLKRPGNNAK